MGPVTVIGTSTAVLLACVRFVSAELATAEELGVNYQNTLSV